MSPERRKQPGQAVLGWMLGLLLAVPPMPAGAQVQQGSGRGVERIALAAELEPAPGGVVEAAGGFGFGFEAVELPDPQAAAAGSVLLPSLVQRLTAALAVDRASASQVRTLRRTAADPLAGREILRLAEREVRKQLSRLDLPLEPIEGTLLDLGAAAGFELGAGAGSGSGSGDRGEVLREETPGRALERAAARCRRGPWVVDFGLAYRLGPRAVPLDRTCAVSVLVRGSRLEIHWRGLPARDRLPAAAELFANVSAEQAKQVASQDFLGRSALQLQQEDLAAGPPREHIWFGSSGPGRLAWTLAVGVKPGRDRPGPGTEPGLSQIEYTVEARTLPGQRVPRILSGVPTAVRGLTSAGAALSPPVH